MPNTAKNFHTTLGEVYSLTDLREVINAVRGRAATIDAPQEDVEEIMGDLQMIIDNIDFYMDKIAEENTSEYDEYVRQHKQTIGDVL